MFNSPEGTGRHTLNNLPGACYKSDYKEKLQPNYLLLVPLIIQTDLSLIIITSCPCRSLKGNTFQVSFKSSEIRHINATNDLTDVPTAWEEYIVGDTPLILRQDLKI